MGEVSRVCDTVLGRPVAFTTLPEAVTADPKRRTGFASGGPAHHLGSSTLREVDSVYSTSACKNVYFAEVVDHPEASPLQSVEHARSCLIRAELRVYLDH